MSACRTCAALLAWAALLGAALSWIGCGAEDTTAPVEDVGQPPGADVTEAPALTEPPALRELTCLDAGPVAEKTWPMDAQRVSVSVFHFNIQYVAGGLDGFLETYTASEEEIEDLIITESFEPLVDLFERHPDWGTSFEMQGLMLEIMAERHPEVLSRLHRLVERGQVEVMSYHWSDRLVVAYGRRELEWGWRENSSVFSELCMDRAPVHFLQEGQYGPGLAAFAAEKGELVVMPRNLMKLHHQPPPAGLWFTNLGSKALTTDGQSGDGLQLGWNYADDGELAATHEANPYLLDIFEHDPEYLAETYEAKLQALHDDGWVIAPISHYVAILEDREVEPTEIDPPVLDGSWQPDDSDNMHLWMGGKGQVPGDERDNRILVTNVIASRRLGAIEERMAASPDVPEIANRLLRHGIRELLLAQVSDSTGWRPVITEVAYSVGHQQAALAVADELEAWLGAEAEAVAQEPFEPLAEAPDGLDGVTLETDRDAELKWSQRDGVYRLEVVLEAGENVTFASESPPAIRLEIPLGFDRIVYSPAGMEGELVDVPLSGYAWASDGRSNGLPLPYGLLAIAEDWTLVLDLSTVHLAALIEPGLVAFEDRTQPNHEAVTWRIHFHPKAAELVSGP